MADRHTRPPISFRPRKEIEAWFYDYAERADKTPGGVLTEAVELLRQQVERGPTTKPARDTPRGTAPTAIRRAAQAAAEPCSHTRAKRMGLHRCPDCTAFLG